MLRLYSTGSCSPLEFDSRRETLPPSTNWIDAFEPTKDEIAFLETVLDVAIPTLESLEEIESSSRLSTVGDAILMSLSVAVADDAGFWRTSPIGFVLTEACVLTVRFARLNSLGSLSKQLAEKGNTAAGGLGATITILEILIDYLADLLEMTEKDLVGVSRKVFAGDADRLRRQKQHQSSALMRETMRTIGRSGELVSTISQSLLGLNRMVPYIIGHAPYVEESDKKRLDVVAQDARSLNDYDQHLTDKAQFLLDTLLGLTNIEQNNVFRVLTVVSVVAIPPTFFASMWGMNFKSMPELDWSYGYTLALSVIVASAVLPALWFKVKGWW